MTSAAGLLSRASTDAPSILLVDDEVAILDGLRRQLRKRFTVHTASGGAEALELLKTEQVSVVVSDMRMPQMNGATFLSEVRSLYPNVVRILLTGQADTQAAITAVNEGQIYRFLTKPCPPEVLLEEIGSAVELNRLVTAEKELLGSTLRRTVEALTATLSLAQPAAFGRALRISRTVTELAEALGVEDAWELEVTAMLSQLGAVTLPPNVLEKLDAGRPLSEEEAEMADRVPEVSRKLVSVIPRLEGVADAIGWQRARYDGRMSPLDVPRGADLPLAARVLRVAVDFDLGTSQRPAVQDTLAAMSSDAGPYDPRILEALVGLHGAEEVAGEPREIGIDDLEPGMVIFDDILTTDDVMLISRGTVVTDPLILRLENYISQGRVGSRMRVQG
ncbi:HD domain-containing phosphohydrolase [Blastococcus tunisiensis]|uniref:Response regulator c-di-GMP phosphodiesterase, RpfG family, contains REC and HD-GYP domains n=1 Tax=Blastococcus tunisiensis TaxID=1798228 RepID=A0A1I2K620_9ACTN|nr:HD domain-containing phosphohydrolase [Blastococcus sp. DSM 46838]SFF61883.1 Response regulator c-di-GMP phosphodiesterase, RpfG family, contains REC and HD-GYP domains [Blastococcus sp. DSM 46838]